LTTKLYALVFDPQLYEARNLVERFFNRIEHFRRVARTGFTLGS